MIEVERIIGEPVADYFRREYEENDRSSTWIADQTGIGPATSLKWLKRFGIPIREKYQKNKIQPPRKKPSRAKLQKLYVQEGFSLKDLIKKYKVSDKTIKKWLGDYEITLRDRSQAALPLGFQRPSKEELNHLYNVQRLDLIDISDKYGVGQGTISRWMEENGIKRRSISEAKLPAGLKVPSEKEMREKYEVKRLSMLAIAQEYNVNHSTVGSWLALHGIKKRNNEVSPGEWKSLDFGLEQGKLFLEGNPEHKELPSSNVLRQRGYGGLAKAINKYYGGFPIFREMLKDHLGKTKGVQNKSLLESYVERQ